MVQTFQPPLMDVGDDTPPELQPIFTFLNSHSNKLYQEGYFLKLDDQNTRRFMSPLRPSILALTMPSCRWAAQPRPNMDGMLCAARGDGSVAVGRRRTRRGW